MKLMIKKYCQTAIFFKINFFNKFFQEHYHGLDPDQDWHQNWIQTDTPMVFLK